jgi:hypothetical protein
MTEEDEEFNRIEREASLRKAAVTATVSKQQTPLSEEWIASRWGKSMVCLHISYREYLAIVREVERAHGIEEKT